MLSLIISNRFITSFYYFVLLLSSFTSFYYFVIEFPKITNFHFKANDLRSTVEEFKSTNTNLKNITTFSFCSADTSEKIFVENFELDVAIVIDVDESAEISVIFKKIENEATAVDESTIIVNDLKTVVDNFVERSERFDFLF